MKIRYGQYPLLFLNCLICIYSLGIYTAEISTLPYKYLFLLLIVNFLIAIYATHKKYQWTFILYVTIFMLLGLLRGTQAFSLPTDSIAQYDNQTVTVEGIIDESPRLRQDNEGNYRLTYVVDTAKVTCAGNAKRVSGKIYLYKKVATLQEVQDINAQVNDTVSTTGKIRLVNGYHNPGLIDRELMAKQQGIYATLTAGKSSIVIMHKDDSFSIKRYSEKIRASILSSLQRAMPESEASLLFAMIFGGYNNIAPELLEAFTVTGIVHILSVSGSHISLLAGFILSLGRLCKLPRAINFMLLLFTIIGYAFLCGFTPPVLRASVMGILSFGALNIQKRYEACHLLSITALVMLLIEPLLLFNISFQLSFASTAGLVYIMPSLRRFLHRLPQFIADNISLTISAQLAVLPLIAWYFNTLSFSSLLANLLVVPPLEFIIILGLCGSVCGLILPFIQHLIFITASLCLGVANDMTLALAQLPLSSIYLPTLPLYIICIYYIALWSILNEKSRKYLNTKIQQSLYRYISVTVIIILLSFAVYISFTEKELTVHFIDVGQGDAALIITPHGKSIMIDTGGNVNPNSDFDIGQRVDLPYLHHYGVTTLDYLILSHSDADHAGGAAAILQKMPVNHLIISNEQNNNGNSKELYAKVLKLTPDNTILKNALIVKEDLHFTVDGVTFHCLANGQNNTSGNEASNVIKLMYRNFSALFTGDIPQERELKLVNDYGSRLSSTILKVAHHGSKTSSSEEFLQTVKPKFAVISVGKYNSFGHPNDDVLSRLEKLPTNILRTDANGAIVFTTDGYKLKLTQFIKTN